MTAGRFSTQKVFWVERNHFWVALKNFPLPLLLVMPVTTLWRYALQVTAVLANRGEVGEFSSQQGVGVLTAVVLRAYISCLAGLPRVLRQRRAVMRSARVPRSAMLRIILRFRLSLSDVLRSDVHTTT